MTLPFFGLPLSKHQYLVTDLGLAAFYEATDPGAESKVIFTLLTDGTWTITASAGDVLDGTPTSGTWLNAGGVASAYEVRYTPSGESGAPVIVNDAAAYTAVSANRVVSVAKTAADASATVLIEIREIADGAFTLSESTQFLASGA